MKKLGLTGIAALTFLYSSACDKPQPPKQPAATQEKDHVEFNISYITSDVPGKYAGVVIQVNNPDAFTFSQYDSLWYEIPGLFKSKDVKENWSNASIMLPEPMSLEGKTLGLYGSNASTDRKQLFRLTFGSDNSSTSQNKP